MPPFIHVSQSTASRWFWGDYILYLCQTGTCSTHLLVTLQSPNISSWVERRACPFGFGTDVLYSACKRAGCRNSTESLYCSTELLIHIIAMNWNCHRISAQLTQQPIMSDNMLLGPAALGSLTSARADWISFSHLPEISPEIKLFS